MSPTSSILATYHTDIPVLEQNQYAPHPSTLLGYLSTAIFTVHSLNHIIAQKEARDRSVAEPLFGLEEEVDGVIIGMGSHDIRGSVVEMEYRRKSGRDVKEWFFVAPSLVEMPKSGGNPKGPQRPKETVMLLEDHPLYPRPVNYTNHQDGEHPNATFSLGLTEEQKRDRDAVVLPYFDAQNEHGVGQGGRILYDMGVEDDFDEEEDEI
jgi:elongator complex protein 5